MSSGNQAALKAYIRRHGLAICIILSILVKQLWVSGLPIWVRDSVGADEYLMLHQAEELLKGNYLGAYDYLTLVKGIMFPLFLAACNLIGVPYLAALTFLYSLACLLALHVLRHFIKNQLAQYVCFMMMLFAPVTYSISAMLVYRDALLMPLVIFLTGSLMMAYLSLKKSFFDFAKWSCAIAVSWIALWHTREDTIWTLPLVAVVTVVLLINIYHLEAKKKRRYLLAAFMPAVALWASIQVLSAANYRNYGIYTANELNDSNYTKAAMLLMKIKPSEEKEYVTISKSAIEQAFRVSPTFRDLEEIIESEYHHQPPMLLAGRDPGNGEFNEDLITWVLRGAANAKGHYKDAKTSEAFWGKVAAELQDAFDDKELTKRAVLPSRSLIPWPKKKGSVKRLAASAWSLYGASSSYENHSLQIPQTMPGMSDEMVKRYEGLTGDYSVGPSRFKVFVDGWVFLKGPEALCTVSLEDEAGNAVASAACEESPDVYEGFLNNQGRDYGNAKTARFHMETFMDTIAGFKLVARDGQGRVVGEMGLDQEDEGIWHASSEHAIDHFDISETQDPRYRYAERRINRLSHIVGVYQACNRPLTYLASVCYLAWTANVIFAWLRKKRNPADSWLFVSSCVGSLIVYIGGLAYVHAFMVDTTRYYLTGVTVLLQMFTAILSALSIDWVWQSAKSMTDKR